MQRALIRFQRYVKQLKRSTAKIEFISYPLYCTSYLKTFRFWPNEGQFISQRYLHKQTWLPPQI